MMESLSVDRSYGRIMLWLGIMQARDDHLIQMNILPVYDYHTGVPEHIDNKQNQHCTLEKQLGTLKWWGPLPWIEEK